MFKNATVDPLAIPSRAPRRPSVGPTRRQHFAAGGPPAEYSYFPDPKAPQFSSEGTNAVGAGGGGGDGVSAFGISHQPNAQGIAPAAPEINYDDYKRNLHNTPEGSPERQRGADEVSGHEWSNGPLKTPWEAPRFQGSIPREVAVVLDKEARAFMAAEGNTDDRSELLYRARRHASTLTSTWSREASEKATQAFCGRVAALIPSKPRVAAAQPVTEFADFDDSLLY